MEKQELKLQLIGIQAGGTWAAWCEQLEIGRHFGLEELRMEVEKALRRAGGTLRGATQRVDAQLGCTLNVHTSTGVRKTTAHKHAHFTHYYNTNAIFLISEGAAEYIQCCNIPGKTITNAP